MLRYFKRQNILLKITEFIYIYLHYVHISVFYYESPWRPTNTTNGKVISYSI